MEENFETVTIATALEGHADPKLKHKGPPLEKGALIHGNYQVEKLLGEGGMGRVYLCLNLKLGNYWAVKHIPRGCYGNYPLDLEAEILKRLNHVYLPKIIDRFEDETGIYIVESYIEGTPLHKKLQAEGPFSEEQVVEWALQLADALAYLHQIEPYPIIYQDMKPSNIMITPENQAIIIDFGVSTEHRPREGKGPAFIGITTAFAAPEQHIGLGDQRSDIHNLGVLLYHLLTKQLPKGNNFETLSLSEGMATILKKALDPDPEKRYQEMAAFKEALKEHQRELQWVGEGGKGSYPLPKDYKKVILCISPEATGKTTVAVNLAYYFSQRRIKTVLIDGDQRKRDIYYHFPKDYENCLAEITPETFLERRYEVNPWLWVYSEHRDIPMKLEGKGLLSLMVQARSQGQGVIVDIGADFPMEDLNQLIPFADHLLLVADQRVGYLNRLQPYLMALDNHGKAIDLVINRYDAELALGKGALKDCVRHVAVGEEEKELPLGLCFTIAEDSRGIRAALANRQPALVDSASLLKEGIEAIAQHYFPLGREKKTGLFSKVKALFQQEKEVRSRA